MDAEDHVRTLSNKEKIRAYLWNEYFSLLTELAPRQPDVDTIDKRGKIAILQELLALTTREHPENNGATVPNLG